MRHCPTIRADRAALLVALFLCGRGIAAAGEVALDQPIAKIGDEVLTLDAVQPDIAFQVYRQQLDIYVLIKNALQSVVERRLLEAEARRRSVSVEELRRAVEAGAKPATDADVDAYLRDNPQASAEPGAHERIAYYLSERARIQARLDFVDDLRKRAGVEILIQPPRQPRVRVDIEGAPSRGPADAPITVVHFASLTSQRAWRSAQQIERLEKEFPGRIRWVHRSFPGDHDETGLAAAQLAAGAAENGKFWEVHDRLLALEGVVKPADLKRIAEDVGVPAQKPGDLAHIEPVKADLAEARRLGLESEPVIFVNGRYHSPTFPYEQLHAMVAEELGDTGAAARATASPPD